MSESVKSIARTVPVESGASTMAYRPWRNSRYVLIRRLGVGATGIVDLAYDHVRGHHVALKRVFSSAAASRLKQEFRAIANLHHPNLITLYDLVVDEDECFFTMEYVEGTDFLTYVHGSGQDSDSGETIDTTEARARIHERLRLIWPQFVAGVRFLHDNRKIHRDLKPANVLIDRHGRLVVLDFGLVHGRSAWDPRSTTIGAVRGTPAYMSPEQVRGQQICPGSDWYAAGVMLYESLVGRLPFDGSPYEVMLAKQVGLTGSERKALQDHGALGQLCLRLMSPAPGRRTTVARNWAWNVLDTSTTVCSRIPRPDSSGIVHLVGRERELDLLDYALTQSAQGSVVALLRGGPAMGKTAVLQRFLARAWPGRLVLSARCDEHETVPYRALDGIVEKLADYLKHKPSAEIRSMLSGCAELRQLFPVLGENEGQFRGRDDVVDASIKRERAISQLRRLMAEVCQREGGLILAIDDLQWGDGDSGRLLREILTNSDAPAMMLLGACRDDEFEESAFLRALRTPGSAAMDGVFWSEVIVPPLDRDQARALAASLMDFDQAHSSLPDEIAQEAQGCPLLVQELVNHHLRSGKRSAPPGSLDDAILARVERLSPAARSLLTVVAVAGHPLWREVALQAAQVTGDCSKVMANLLAERLIRVRVSEDGEQRLELHHSAIRTAMLSGIPAASRRGIHSRLALALVSLSKHTPELLALHWQRSGDPGKASIHAEAAAIRASEVFAFERAARLYALALDNTSQESHRRVLRLRLAQALTNAGHCAEAAPLFLELAHDVDQTQSVALKMRAATNFLVSGHTADGIKVLRGILATLGLRYPQNPWWRAVEVGFLFTWIRLRGTRFTQRAEADIDPHKLVKIDVLHEATAGFSITDPTIASHFLAQNVLRSLDAGEPRRVAWSLLDCALGFASRGTRGIHRAERLIHEAERIQMAAPDPLLQGLVLQARGIASACRAQWLTALTPLRESERFFRTHGRDPLYWLGPAQWMEGFCLLMLGQFQALEDSAREWIQDAEHRCDLRGASHSRMFAAFPALLRGETALAREMLRPALDTSEAVTMTLERALSAVGRVYADLYDGRCEEAFRGIQGVWKATVRSGLVTVQILRILLMETHACAALALGATGHVQSLRVARRLARKLERERIPWAEGVAAFVRAALASTEGNSQKAAVHMLTASDSFDQAGMFVHAAAARLNYTKLSGSRWLRDAIEQDRAQCISRGVPDLESWACLWLGKPGTPNYCFGRPKMAVKSLDA